jgi:transposase-like protein
VSNSNPITQFVLPYHPAYGLDDKTRVEVLRLVVDWQVKPAEAARIHNLGQSTVYKWLAAAGHRRPKKQPTKKGH